ncbi:K02A2.6-like [Cordylochernes scorpioides]|uniref:RNA-directed DNA polymerase n=1 Tax=Cordylochernes scorpioides TaxID=51811 RepID=A0ABY6KUU7_9ARAC|nr:K02A2.6-like [Cordylochernes scorpioides]
MSQNYNCVAPEPFNFSNPGDWPKWIRRFERFRQASGLINNPENEQVNMLVYCMGDNADDILLSCKIASDQLENYDKVIECFESHFIPRRNIIYERARFNQRCQQEGEKVNEFITALHSLAEHCNFEMLHDELIRDRIVVGVRDRALSERMQLDTDLTLEKATLMAKQLESVKEQQSSLYQQDSVDQIKKMPNHIKETKRHEPKIRQFKSNQLGGSSHGCTRCGNSNNHDWKSCPAMNSYCNKCMKKGHYAKVCRSEAINEIKSEIAFLGSVEDNSKKWIVPIKVNNRQVNFKIDTGADVNVLPLQYYYQSFQRIKLEKSDKVLQGPNGIPLETVGMIHVKLQNNGQHLNSKIYIVDKLKQPLLSGETSEKLNIVRMIQQLSSNFLNPKREFPKIFNGLGHAKINYKISLQPDAKPYALCTPRRVPIPLMKQVKEQLEEMTRLGVIESVEEPTEWCAGMVAVSKPGGKIRICVDLTKLNQYIRRENYPLPATEHILGQLGNACYFSKLDANSGFWQFGLAKESQKLTTFITPFGRFFFKRIPFGITSAPEIFQRKMTQLLGNIEGVVCFMDDIVVYGSSLEEHNERVRQVLKKIQEEGMTPNPEKCQFGVKTVKFLGHTLSSEGLFIDEEKLDAITKMEAPRSTKELKSFLGMVNYLGKFIPNLADKLQPLNSLLSTKNEWVWDEPQKKSFNLLKQELVSRPNLALFDPSRTTIVSADASSFGIGGVLRQEQPDGSLKPIAYKRKKRYSQIEKEGLAIVWTCDRLKDYVTGIKIHIETDHKPLIAIFTSKSLEDMTPRLQRLKMRMMRYSYQISHIAGKKQIVADMLSRKPMSKPHKDELEEELSAYIQSIEFPATEERLLEISRKQKEDSLCSQLAEYCMSGWPKNKREVDPELRGYWQFQEDLTYQNGLLLRGQRILIPKTLRKDILEKLHQGHFGINKCRSRARESVWWLGISQEIERMVSSCTKCLKERKPKHEPLMPSEFPIRPWQKVGMDLFYLNGRWYLIVCDYYSRNPEISLLQNLTAQEVIGRLKSIFARHGTPETVRSDNGPQFQKVLGSEFSKFSKEWSFKHITSSPKFPQSNGFIEAIIKNIKQSFKKEEYCYRTLQAYRTMPLESGYSPAELLMGRRLRTSVPAIESSLMPRYLDSEALQEREKRRVINQKRLYDKRHDVHSLPPLQQGDSVWIRDQRVKGKVLHKSEEPRSYWVQTPQGKVRRNRLHLTPLPKMGSTMDASEDDQDDQEQETEEDCPTPTASSTRDGRMQRDNQDQDPEKSLPSMPAVHTRYGRAVKIPRRFLPVVFASRTLNKTERRYAVIDKEALAVIFGVSKFSQYLLGRKFKILTDHKPLVGMFNPKKPIPQVLSPRMLRWCLTLAAYTYSIEYKPGKVNCNADALSRLPLNECPSVVPNPSEVFFIESEHAAINSSEVAKLTSKDPILSKIKFWAMNGWPERKVDDKFKDFVSKSNEISIHKDCLLWGSRVIIPERLRKDILNLLHDTHIGIVRTKALARGLCWWPKMDGDIERMISSCAVCLSCSHDLPKTDVYPWIWPSRPWSRLHIDHAGPFQGKLFLVVIDAYSKWIEAKIVSTTSTETTINSLKEIFATHGLPDVIVSDNGTSFTSELFRTFLKRNGVRHILCAPYHAASNGQVERAIQTLKNLLRKNSSGNWTTRLSRSLLSMRIAINSTTQKSPAQLLMNRNLRSLIDKFHPESVSEGRIRQEDRFIRNWKPHRVVNEGQAVIARGYNGPRWLPGVVQEKTGPVSIKVETDDGEILNRHLDQVRGCGESEATPSTSSTPQESTNIEDPQAGQEIDPTGEASGPTLRRSSRLRRPSKFFEM